MDTLIFSSFGLESSLPSASSHTTPPNALTPDKRLGWFAPVFQGVLAARFPCAPNSQEGKPRQFYTLGNPLLRDGLVAVYAFVGRTCLSPTSLSPCDSFLSPASASSHHLLLYVLPSQLNDANAQSVNVTQLCSGARHAPPTRIVAHTSPVAYVARRTSLIMIHLLFAIRITLVSHVCHALLCEPEIVLNCAVRTLLGRCVRRDGTDC